MIVNRNSGGKSYKTQYKNWMAPKPRKPVTLETPSAPAFNSSPIMKSDVFEAGGPEQFIRPKSKAALYVFGKKSHMKVHIHRLCYS